LFNTSFSQNSFNILDRFHSLANFAKSRASHHAQNTPPRIAPHATFSVVFSKVGSSSDKDDTAPISAHSAAQ
jgi:hypothetical protein